MIIHFSIANHSLLCTKCNEQTKDSNFVASSLGEYNRPVRLCAASLKTIEVNEKIFFESGNLGLSLAQTARFLSLRAKIFVAGDENLLCAEDKISVASDKNRDVCARLYV